MKTRFLLLAAASAALLSASTSPCQAQPIAVADITHLTFEDDVTAWFPFGTGARVSITRDADNVHEGNAALQFNYTLAPNNLQAMALPAAGNMAGLTSIHFWVKSDASTPLVLMLQEGDAGARYLASIYAPANTWQEVKLAPSDFWNWTDRDSPRDDNGQLDLEKVNIAALGDFAQFFIGQPVLQDIFKAAPGPRVLYLDDFSASSTDVPATPVIEGVRTIDDFSAPQLSWWNLGDTVMQRVQKNIAGQPIVGVQIDYRQQKGVFGGIIRRLPAGQMSGMTSLQMSVSSQRAATLVVQVEEEGGGKYNTTIDIKAGAEAQTVTLNLADLKAADDSKDQNGRLDADQVNQLLILDASIFTAPEAGNDNTVWVGGVQATKQAAP